MKSTKAKTKAKKKDVLGADELDAKNGKFRVTMFIDLDLFDEIRKRAGDKRLPYQTYINQLLREQVLGSNETEHLKSR